MKILYLKKSFISSLLFTSLIFGGLIVLLNSNYTSAAPVTGFDPGYIISDNVFTNDQSMTVNQIQDFLESKVPVCDTNGTQISEYGGPDLNSDGKVQRWEWGKHHYNQTTFPCLKDYKVNNISSAQVIYNASQKYQINPQVLIVLLQKEQGLVTDTWPLNIQYRSATGYGCPDTAACDSQYYGLTNQINWSATMFRAILNNSSTWYTPYVLGNNYIRYNPVESCGGSTVNIQNRSTQALYNYTPYQPNQSALNAGYGNGDSCGAYGNRNFYLYFSDWFGSPQYGNLVRTKNNATVYIVSGDNKYPIDSLSMLNMFSRLGSVTYATDAYLNSKTTGRSATNLIKSDSSSSLYFINAGIKLPFGSCTVAAHYERPCGSEITLTQAQVNMFANGPTMSRLYETTSGVNYYIENGTKREIFDDKSIQEAGISGYFIRLLDTGIAHLSNGKPLVRDNVVTVSKSNQKSYLYQNGKILPLPDDILSDTPISKLSRESLSQASLDLLTTANSFSGFIQDSMGKKYLLDSSGKVLITDTQHWPAEFSPLNDSLISLISNSTQPINSRFIMSDKNSTIYYIYNGKKHPIASWKDFVNLHPDRSTELARLPSTTVSHIPTATNIYAPGSMVKANDSATVYVVTGILEKTPLGSFAVSNDLGLSGIGVLSREQVNGYSTSTPIHDNFIICDGKNYAMNLGKIYEINEATAIKYGYVSVGGSVWDVLGCSNLTKSQHLLSNYSFVKPSNSRTIYYVKDGKKHPIGSMDKYTELGGDSSTTLIVSSRFADTIASGSTM